MSTPMYVPRTIVKNGPRLLNNRRRNRRLPVEGYVFCRNSHWGGLLHSVDISIHALGVQGRLNLPLGRVLQAQFSLPGSMETLEVTAMVYRKCQKGLHPITVLRFLEIHNHSNFVSFFKRHNLTDPP